MSVAETVRKMRMGLCLEQKLFAEELGISRGAIVNYETGKRMPRLSIIKSMLEFAQENGMDFSLNDFLETKQKPIKRKPIKRKPTKRIQTKRK